MLAIVQHEAARRDLVQHFVYFVCVVADWWQTLGMEP
jgi:hypothetical protein